MSSIVLLGQGNHRPKCADLVGIPFEIAPGGALYKQYPDAIPLASLIGDFEDKKLQAHALVQRLLADEPPLRGLRQLGIFEEVVIREMQRGFHCLNLHDYLLENGIEECVFDEPSSLSSALSSLTSLLGSKLRVTAAVGGNLSVNSMNRSWQRLRASGFAPAAIRAELHELVRRIDPFHRRRALGMKKGSWRRDEIWYYSTAHTFTNIGLLYEPYFPESLRFLIENSLTGGMPLKKSGRPYVSLYDFAANKFAPSFSELDTSRDVVRRHLMSVPLSDHEKILRDLFIRSSFFQTFLWRHLPHGLFVTRVFERWLDTVRPAALVTGNPVFEGPALQLARRRGIPTVVLQHGILGDFCQFIDPPTDHYVVRGAFWRDFLAPPVRPRALILNPPERTAAPLQSPGHRRSIVFFTAPYSMQEFWNETDLDDIIRALLVTAASEQVELIIRVHPLERVAEYQARLTRLSGKAIEGVKLTFSQGTDLRSLLVRSAVAVTYASTVFLDCIKEGVPIISFDWHNFSYKRQIERYGVFHFAQSLVQLQEMLTVALQGSLKKYVGTTELFLASSTERELKVRLAAAVRRGERPGVHVSKGALISDGAT